jgi:hypothetical protein
VGLLLLRLKTVWAGRDDAGLQEHAEKIFTAFINIVAFIIITLYMYYKRVAVYRQ